MPKRTGTLLRGVAALASTALLLALPLSSAATAGQGYGPFGNNNGAAAATKSTGINGIISTFTVPVDTINTPAYCGGSYQAYLVVPSGCRTVSNGEGGNVRPMQIVAYNLTDIQRGDFVATGMAAGCVDIASGKICTGWGSNGQAYKRIYTDSVYYGQYNAAFHDVVAMGSSHSIQVQREVRSGVGRWHTYYDGREIASLGADGTFRTGVGVVGVESASRVVLNMFWEGWRDTKIKNPNFAYSTALTPVSFNNNSPAPGCYMYLINTEQRGQGSC